MRDLIQVICENLDRTIEVEMGTSLLDIQRQYLPKGPHPYLAAYVNNRIKELNYKVYTPITVRYIDATHFEGIRVYERTASFILQRAVRELYPEHKFYIRHSMLRGFYCEIEGRDGISAREAEAIRTRMEELVDAAIPIIRSRVRSIDAAMEFTRLGFDDKTELLNTRPRLYSTLYSLGDMKGYFYGALAPSTDYIRLFDIRPYYNGFYVVLPGRSHPDALKPLVAQDKLFDIFHQYKEWVDIMGVPTVGRLNAKVLAGDASELIKIAEAFHEKRLARIADTIAAANRSQGTRMVLISGPSSSGKTTSAKRLGIQLRILGLNPVLISLDDYFVDRDKTPRDADGEYDYEALEAIDLRLFNDHLQRLFAGESLPVPRYDFITGKRQWHDNPLRLDDRSVLIVEGIHGLNPRLTPSIPDHMKFKIYISCFTSVAMAHRHHRQPPAAPHGARQRHARPQRAGDARTLGERAARRGEAHLPLSGERRRDVQLVAFLRDLGAAPLCRTYPARGARYGARIRRGQAAVEIPRQLHPDRSRRDSAHLAAARIHRRQQFQVLTKPVQQFQT